MSFTDDLALLEETAESQHGYVTRAQAAHLGLSDVDIQRLAKRGDLRRVEHGIYRFRGAGSFRWEPVWVAWLRLDPERTAFERTRKPTELVAGRTAAWVYGLGDLDPEPYDFIVATRHQTRRASVRFRRGVVPRSDWEIVDGIPVTRPQRIVGDLLAQHVDVEHVVDIAAGAVRQGMVTLDEILEPGERALSPDQFLSSVRSAVSR